MGSGWEATLMAAGVWLSGVVVRGLMVPGRDSKTVSELAGTGLDFAAACHAGGGAESFFLAKLSLDLKQELPAQPVNSAGAKARQANQGLMFMGHLATPRNPAKHGRSFPNGAANNHEDRRIQ